jgi:hypothetical protein
VPDRGLSHARPPGGPQPSPCAPLADSLTPPLSYITRACQGAAPRLQQAAAPPPPLLGQTKTRQLAVTSKPATITPPTASPPRPQQPCTTSQLTQQPIDRESRWPESTPGFFLNLHCRPLELREAQNILAEPTFPRL